MKLQTTDYFIVVIVICLCPDLITCSVGTSRAGLAVLNVVVEVPVVVDLGLFGKREQKNMVPLMVCAVSSTECSSRSACGSRFRFAWEQRTKEDIVTDGSHGQASSGLTCPA